MKRYFVSTVCAAVVPVMAWLAGYNFDKRGEGAFFTAWIAITVWVLVFVHPHWAEKP
jgi:hypothetical protein